MNDGPALRLNPVPFSPPARPYYSDACFAGVRWDDCQSLWLAHAPFAFWLAGALRPSRVVGLGCGRGVSQMAFCQAVLLHGLDCEVHGVADWSMEAGVFTALDAHNRGNYAAFSNLTDRELRESHGQFADGSVDILSVDGGDACGEVLRNPNGWLSKLARGGVLLVHPAGGAAGADLWKGIAASYPHFEFYHAGGLGIVCPGTVVPEGLRGLVGQPSDGEIAEAVRATYEFLGRAAMAPAMEKRLGGAGPASRDASVMNALDAVRADLRALGMRAREMETALESVEVWQRSWIRRVFTRWHRHRESGKAGVFRRIERAIRSARKSVLRQGPASAVPVDGPHFCSGEVRSPGKLVPPQISVIVLAGGETGPLAATLASLRGQKSGAWEALVAWQGTDGPAGLPDDPRLRIFPAGSGEGAEGPLNRALASVGTPFAAFLRAGDLLSDDAIGLLLEAMDTCPDARILYSDEEHQPDDGGEPVREYKSAWNPDLFFSRNYPGRPLIVSAGLAAEAGGFRGGFDGAHEYDLFLRCLPHVSPEAIAHLPHILCCRTRPGTGGALVENGGEPAGMRALRDFFKRTRVDGGAVPEVSTGPLADSFRLTWPVPAEAPLVSLLVPTRDRVELIGMCAHSILERTDYRNFELLILDNGSTDARVRTLYNDLRAGDPRVRVLDFNGPFNYSAINNFGASHAEGSVLGFINNDIEVISGGWLAEMLGHALRPDIGCVGAKLYYPDDTIQHGGVVLGIGGVAGHAHRHLPREHPGGGGRLRLAQNYSAVTAACLLVRKAAFEAVGGFDAENLVVALNDVDLCLKMRAAGLRNVWTPFAELYHHESASRGPDDSPEKRMRFAAEFAFMKKKWAAQLAADPFYNPNLSDCHEDLRDGTPVPRSGRNARRVTPCRPAPGFDPRAIPPGAGFSK